MRIIADAHGVAGVGHGEAKSYGLPVEFFEGLHIGLVKLLEISGCRWEVVPPESACSFVEVAVNAEVDGGVDAGPVKVVKGDGDTFDHPGKPPHILVDGVET